MDVSRRWILGAAAAGSLSRRLEAIPLESVKLGVTSDEIDDDPAVAADFLQRFKLHYAEVRNVWGKYNTAQPIEKIREVRTIFDSRQVRTSIVDTALFRSAVPVDGAAVQREWTLLDDAMQRGDVLGTKLLRIFAFVPKDRSIGDTSAYPRSYE